MRSTRFRGHAAESVVVGLALACLAAGCSSHEPSDAGPYEEIACALERQFAFGAVAVTLPLALRNRWSAVVAARGKTYHAPRYEVEVVDRFGAGDAFSEALALDPGHVRALNNRGVCRLRLGQADGAVADFLAALALDPEFAEARRNLETVGRAEPGGR